MRVSGNKQSFDFYNGMFMQLFNHSTGRNFMSHFLTSKTNKMQLPSIKKTFAFPIAMMYFFSAAYAQILYTNVKSNRTFSCSKIGRSHQYHFDLTNDWITDLILSV